MNKQRKVRNILIGAKVLRRELYDQIGERLKISESKKSDRIEWSLVASVERQCAALQQILDEFTD